MPTRRAGTIPPTAAASMTTTRQWVEDGKTERSSRPVVATGLASPLVRSLAGPEIFLGLQRADLLCEPVQINVVSNNDVPLMGIHQEIVAQRCPLCWVTRADNTRCSATLGEQ